MDALGLECIVEAGAEKPDNIHASQTDFIVAKLTEGLTAQKRARSAQGTELKPKA
jgi:hypothetical protein